MFTGLVHTTVELIDIIDKSVDKDDLFRTFVIKLPKHFAKDLELGASVAHNGCCLSVTNIDDLDADNFAVSFDLIHPTLSLTNLGLLEIGAIINIERSFRVGSEVGGHILSGHIYGVVEICKIIKSNNNYQIEFIVPDHWKKYIIDKGFIALDGISLTVSSITEKGATINLIPDTLERTNLKYKKIGDYLNLELDNNTVLTVNTVENVLKNKYVF